MRNSLIALFALASFCAMADAPLNQNQFQDGQLTNVPPLITAGATSNINAIILTAPGHGIALFPLAVGTNATTSNIVVSVSFARDRTLTNFTSTTRLYTNTLAGTTAIAPLIYVPVADCDAVCAIRVNSIQSLDGSYTTTISGIGYSARW